MDAEIPRVLCLDPADSVVVLGEISARIRGEMRPARLVCVIHRAQGEFTHLYRVPAVPIGGRREVELLGVWEGTCLREASDRVSAMLAVPDPAWKRDRSAASLRAA